MQASRRPPPATLRARCAPADSPYGRACRAATLLPVPGTMPPGDASQPVISLAVRYLLYSEASVLGSIRQQVTQIGPYVDTGDPQGALLANAPRLRQLAVVYDWLYDALLPSDRTQLESYIRSYADWYIAHEPTDVFSAETYAQASAVGLAGLALATGNGGAGDGGAGDGGAGADATRYLTYADTRWKNTLLPALAYVRDWWPEGPGYFHRVVAPSVLYWAAAWTTATDEDAFAYARSHGDPFGAFIQYEAYALRPDFRYAAFGDATDPMLTPALRTRPVLDMLAWGTGSTVAQGLAEEVTRREPAAQDYAGTEAWHQLVFYDPARPDQPDRTTLPTARHLSQGAEDVVVMRSGWGDSDTWVSFSCGDYFTAHDHDEVASVQIHRLAPLLVSTGYFDGVETPHWINWFAQHSVHASTLSVVQPSEVFPNTRMLLGVNDGGQRPTESTTGRRTLDEYRANLTAGAQYDTGGMTAFESGRFHDYAACDATRAYNSTAFALAPDTAKVREVTRQLVFLRPQLVVVFDRVEATDPAYEKHIQWHGLTRPVLLDANTWVVSTNTTRLLGRTLLPANPTRTVIDGFTVGSTDVSPTQQGSESRGVRLEIASPLRVARDYFLHVLDAADPSHDSLPGTTLVDDGERVGVRVADPAADRMYTVTFHRTGPPAGDILVSTTAGAALYQGALGAGGTLYPPVPDAGAPGTPDGGAPDAGRPAATPPGCSCRGAPVHPSRGALTSALALVALGRRRWRRRQQSQSQSQSRSRPRPA